MAWLLIPAVPVVAVVWICALLMSETFAAFPTRAAAVHALRDPHTTPIAPFGPLIRLWLRLERKGNHRDNV